jgi:chromosome segregation ATPase
MKEITNNEKNILNNFKEHLNVIREEINTFNKMKDLSVIEYKDILKKKEDADKILKKILKDIESSTIELESIRTTSQRIANKMADSQEKFEDEKDAFEEYKTSSLQEIESNKKSLDTYFAERNAELSMVIKHVDHSKKEIIELEKSKEAIQQEIASLENTRNEVQSEIDSKKKEYEDNESLYQKQMNRFAAELSDAEKKVQDAVAKVLEPHKILDEREQQVARKERNLKIMEDLSLIHISEPTRPCH